MRWFLAAFEFLIYGIDYSILMFLSRSKKPLDPDVLWNLMTRPLPSILNWFREHYPPLFWRRIFVDAKLKVPHHVGVEAHYDISNDFYQLWLDRKYMFYTCADFPTGKETLEEAQDVKVDFLLNLIEPKAGEKILDIGCGWGGMMNKIYEKTKDKENLLGLNLSKEQVRFINEKYGFKVKLENCVTAPMPEKYFDKIYSIEVVEHIRPAEIYPFFKKLHQSLKDDGKVVKHFICYAGENVYHPRTVAAQIVFPGFNLSSYAHHVECIKKAGFSTTHTSFHDYRGTLKAWFQRLAENKEKAIKLVGVHVYNRYLAYLAGAWRIFDDKELILVRLVLKKAEVPRQ